MPILTKSELVATLAEKTGSSKVSVHRFLDALQDTVIDAVASGDEVKLTGFVAFAPSTRSARTVKNPQTGEMIEVAEAKVVKVRPLGAFRDAVRKAD